MTNRHMVQPIMRRVFGVVVLAIMMVVVAIGAAEAVTIDLGPGSLDAFLLFDFSSNLLAFDVRGTQTFIVGNPGRTPEDHRLRMVNITRPSDGWKWGGTFD